MRSETELGSGYEINIKEPPGHLMEGTYQYQCRLGEESIYCITYRGCYSMFSGVVVKDGMRKREDPLHN
jgi:hypothetical protein